MPSPASAMSGSSNAGPVTRRARSGARGFTLIEAIVAIAIVGIALVPLITFIGQMATALTRAGDVNARSLAQQATIELLETLNPMERPIGEDQVGDLIIRWESQNVVKPSPSMRVGSGLAGFSVGFYNVAVTVERAGRGPWFTFDMRKVGFKIVGATGFPGMPQQ